MSAKSFKIIAVVLVSCLAVATVFSPNFTSGAAEKSPFKKILNASESLAPNASKSYALEIGAKLSSLSVSIPTPSAMGDTGTIEVTLREGEKIIASKPLHVGDPDLYLTFRANKATLELKSNTKDSIAPNISVLQWPDNKSPNVEAEPNNSWQDANEFQLGKTMFATADDISYIVPLNADTKSFKRGYEQTPEYDDRLPEGGADWFKFNYEQDKPSLVHFEIDLLERDNIPVDVSVFSVVNNQAVPYEKGADPVTPPHEVQALPGNKFTTRVLTKGTYYVRVEARHPAYQLRTYIYDVAPYTDPRKAVRAGMDYIVSAGDSWHANTPRHGGIVNRVSNNHNETMGCVACHATHFPLRAELTAKQNGYTINKRAAVQFLTERFYNTTRPFYGYPDASWTRVISASANVLSRMAGLLNIYENEITGEKHPEYLKGVVNYLKLYYKGRTTLPPDESNGNTPLVSAYEVAMYSWKAFDENAKQNGDAESIQYRDLTRKLIEQDRHKNLIDLCYQTMALTMIDAKAYAEKIKRNSERILSLQRADGQWSMLFEPDSSPVEFQTGHSLYTLALAGYTPENPKIKRGVDYLLSRQQEWGGWFDPRQSYENFRTPFRETQFAVMALSQLYPEANKQKGWNAETSEELSDDPYLQLEQMNKTWDMNLTLKPLFLESCFENDEPLIRQQALAMTGRLKKIIPNGLGPKAVDNLASQNKMVQLASAWSTRVVRGAMLGTSPLGFVTYEELTKPSPHKDGFIGLMPASAERLQWGLSRIFSQHFKDIFLFNDYYGEYQKEILKNLNTSGSPVVRMQAAKTLTQWYYWAKHDFQRLPIVDAIIARIGTETHPWVRRNLIESLYSMADENVRYLYNNWIGLLPQAEDRERAKLGHRNNSLQMATRIARALENGNNLQREGLLQAITEFHLRAGGYAGGGRYTRIGNDIENVQFYDEGAKLIEKSLVPLISSDNQKIRRQAIIAANTVRDQSLDSLPLLVLQQLNDPSAEIRNAAQETYRLLPLEIRAQNKQAAIGILKSLLASQYPAAQTAGLERLKVFSNSEATAEKLDAAVRDFALKADRQVAPAAILALSEFPQLSSDSEIQSRISSALQASEMRLQTAAAQLTMSKSEWRAAPSIKAALDGLLKSKDVATRRLILCLVTDTTSVQRDLGLPAIVAESCYDVNDQVRAAALSAARRAPSLLKNNAVKTGLAKLMVDNNPSLQEQAVAFVQGQGDTYLDGAAAVAKAAANVSQVSKTNLDYNYFAQRVMPLLATKGADGNACMTCHFNHTILKLNLPGADGKFTEEQLRDNFTSALRVVNPMVPENSLILRKPLGNADVEGQVGARKIAHGGGQRWTGVDDAAYKTILDWINGAKLTN